MGGIRARRAQGEDRQALECCGRQGIADGGHDTSLSPAAPPQRASSRSSPHIAVVAPTLGALERLWGMKPPHYDPDQLLPLSTPERIEARVRALVGRATRREIWFLFINPCDAQLPIILPLEDHPSLPAPGDQAGFTRMLSQVGEAIGAVGVIVVIERYADHRLSPSDLAWASILHAAARESSLILRGMLLSHTRGIRWVAPDDYLFPVDVASA